MRLHHRGIILVSCVLVGLAGPMPAQAFFDDWVKKTLENPDKVIEDLKKAIIPEAGTSSSKDPSKSGAAGWSEPGTPGTDPYFKSAFNKALESARTGSKTPWSNPKTGERGAITPTATFKEAGGTPCRKYRWTLVTGASSRLFEGTACRMGAHNWQVRKETEQQSTVAGAGSSDTPWLSGQGTGAQGAAQQPGLATPQSSFNSDKQMVADAQRLLNQLGYNAGAADGLYGKNTRLAIRAFQKDRGLPAGGNVTPQLLAQLSQAPSTAGASPAVTATSTPATTPSGAAASPTAGSTEGLIAFVRSGQIYLIHADGSGETQLTDRLNADGSRQPRFTRGAYPAWSPDGSKIAFVSRTGPLLMNADGTGLTRLPNRLLIGAHHPAWSPDGSKIAFPVGDRIFVMNADGTGLTQLRDQLGGQPLQATAPAWSPNGAKIVFVGRRGLWLVNADGSGKTQLTTRSGGLPAWSPDGSKIVFVGRHRELFLMNADGSGLTGLTNVGRKVNDPAWSPDGSKIAFATIAGLWLVNADGTGLTRLTDVVRGFPAWSPDGSRIAFSAANRIYVMNADGSGLTRLTAGKFPAWSPLPAGENVTPQLVAQLSQASSTAGASPAAAATSTPATTPSGAAATPTVASTEGLITLPKTDEMLGVCEVDPETDEVRLTSLHTSTGIALPSDVALGALCTDADLSLSKRKWKRVGRPRFIRQLLDNLGFGQQVGKPGMPPCTKFTPKSIRWFKLRNPYPLRCYMRFTLPHPYAPPRQQSTVATTPSGAAATPTVASTEGPTTLPKTDEMLAVCEVDPETKEVRLKSSHTSTGVTLPSDAIPGAFCSDVALSLLTRKWKRVKVPPFIQQLLDNLGFRKHGMRPCGKSRYVSVHWFKLPNPYPHHCYMRFSFPHLYAPPRPQSAVAGAGSGDAPWLSGQGTGAQGAVQQPGLAAPQSNPKIPSRQQRKMVAEAQRVLNQLGYNAGAADGLYSEKTRLAIRAFRKDRGLPARKTSIASLLRQLYKASRTAGASPTAGSTDELLGGCEDDPETGDLRLTSLHTYPSGITLPAEVVLGASCMDVFQRLTVVGWSLVSGPIPVKAILTRFGFDIAGPLKWCGIGLRGGFMRRFVANSPCVIVFVRISQMNP